MNIVLTKYPSRQFTMGLSMSMGAGTPPTPSPTVRLWSTTSAWTETFADGKIPDKYYSGRTDLVKVQVDGGITYLGDRAFCDCVNLSAATVDGQSQWKGHSFMGCTSLQEVVIGSKYTTIEGWAFSACTSLEKVVIPDNIAFLGGYSFQNCTSLQEVTLSSTLTNIGINMFYGCISLTSITCTAPTAPSLGNNVFRNVASDGTLYVPVGSDYSTWLAALPVNWTVVDVSDFHQFASLDDMRTWLPWHVDPENKPQNSLQILYEDGVRLTIDSGNTLQLSTGEQLFIDDGGTIFDPSTGEEATSELLEIFESYVGAGASIKVPKDEKEERLFLEYYVGDATPLAGQEQWEEAGMPNNPYSPSIEGWLYDSYVNEYPQEEDGLLADYVEVPAGMDWSAYFDYGGDLISESGASVEAVYFTLDSMVINVYDNNFIDAGSLGQYDIINNNGNCEWVLHSTGESPQPESQEEEDMMTLNENFETSIFISGGAVYVRYKCTAGNVESVRFGGNGSGEGYYVNQNVLEDMPQE